MASQEFETAPPKQLQRGRRTAAPTQSPRTAIDEALRWLGRGAWCIPIPARSKAATIEEWPSLRLGEAELRACIAPHGNLGLLLGEPSGGIVDVDLDCPEALAIADRFLPATGCEFGRQTHPRSHRLYRATPCAPKTTKWQDPAAARPDKATLVELRSSGCQTIIPPSVYPEGDRCIYAADGDLAEVDGTDLECRVRHLAAACLLARHWPAKGARQDAALALAGGLLRTGWKQHEVEHFMEAVVTAAGDEEVAKRVACVRDTAERLRCEGQAWGWPKLAELLGDRVVDRARTWLLPQRVGSDGETLAEQEEDGQTLGSPGKRSQGTVMYGLASKGIGLVFHDADGELYAALPVDGHREVVTISERGGGLTPWLVRLYRQHTGRVPSSTALRDAARALASDAICGPGREVHVRVAGHAGKMYLDLCRPDWQVVEVDAQGWRLVNESPVVFRRPQDLRPLPIPLRGGSLKLLWDLFPQAGEEGLILLTAWLLGSLHPTGPYPVLVVVGGQGSGKTVVGGAERSIVDPAGRDGRGLVGPPKDAEDLIAHARGHHVLGFDNVSALPGDLSDAICRIATGAGLSKRRLYTDHDEALVYVRRPVIMNGIGAVATRGDLIDRSLIVRLGELTTRKPEHEFWAEVDRLRPYLLGALLDAVSCALARYETVPDLPADLRMADFAKWIVAAEPGLPWEPGAFLRIYGANRRAAVEAAIEASPLPDALEALMDAEEISRAGREWEGTATELLTALNSLPTTDRMRRDWPKSANSLSQDLNRLAPSLRTSGRVQLSSRLLNGRTRWRVASGHHAEREEG